MTQDEKLVILEALMMWSNESYHGLGTLGSTKTPGDLRAMTEALAKELEIQLPEWFLP